MSSAFDDLLAALAAAPDLPGAACRGMSAAFDEPAIGEPAAEVAYRHGVALDLCGQCPSLTRCRDWLLSLPARQRPTGVVAGRVGGPSTKRRRAVA